MEWKVNSEIAFRPFEPWDAVTAVGSDPVTATVLDSSASAECVKLLVSLSRSLEYHQTTYRKAVIEIPSHNAIAIGGVALEGSLLGVPPALEGDGDLLLKNWWRGGLALLVSLDSPSHAK